MDKRVGGLAVVILIATAGDVLAECVDLNDAAPERLTAIVHFNEERADQDIAGRPIQQSPRRLLRARKDLNPATVQGE